MRKRLSPLQKLTLDICEEYEIQPKRSKGQNFLINEEIYDNIVDAAELSEDDIVLEVGPGLGFLTRKLAEKAKKVISVELDDKIYKMLSIQLKEEGYENVELINKNVLDLEIEKLIRNSKLEIRNYKVVANLPYNITSIFLRKMYEQELKPSMMVLMLQKEVVNRVAAKPGDMSMLALSVQYYAEPEIVGIVQRHHFWPSPDVDSAVIRLKTKSPLPPFIKGVSEKELFRVAKFGFGAKRKMLKNNLAGGLHITAAEAEKLLIDAGLSAKVRAEDLSLEDWAKLVASLS